MYSIVLLSAMSAGADVTPPAAPPAVAPVAVGCYGSCLGSSCFGYSAGCQGSCFGCRGGGGLFGLRAGRGACHGCSGFSCVGSSCFGSCFGCAGSTWGPTVMMPPYSPHAVYGSVRNPNLPPVIVVPVAPMTKPSNPDGEPVGANLRFKVPAAAKLYVDGKLAPGSGEERAFYTPPLERGKKFFYEVKAELVVGDKTVTEEKKVIVEAGANITEEFAKLTAAVARPDTTAGK